MIKFDRKYKPPRQHSIESRHRQYIITTTPILQTDREYIEIGKKKNNE